MMALKQVIVVRKDLNMRKGKMAAQAAHASLTSVVGHVSPTMTMDDESKILRRVRDLRMFTWLSTGMTKVVVGVDSLDELHAVAAEARQRGLSVHYVTDAGRTEVEPGTVTCIAIGPDDAAKIDEVTGGLKLL